ncbi:MAG TPA: hypothetical protein VGX25_01550 [Actinophytocola sp.]|uniref:sensor histidine kinase n=1 Tax=Actinophytocola sp. TaxID=1872138 RepID=UPI002DDCA311|nr:hypothetical protein [Actinophytocola sp.]HEV2778062.1 hypothetical protein [Actinophytocola sp.]
MRYVRGAGERLPAGAGEAVRRLYRLGRLFAIGVRAGTLPLSAVIGLLAAQPDLLVVMAIATGALVAWSAVYVRALLVHPARWHTVIDAVMLGALGLCAQWLVPATWLAHGDSWVLALAGFACVGYQCHTEIVLGSVVTLIVVGGAVCGTLIAPPNAMLFMSSWMVVAAALSRVQWILVRRGGRIADEQMAAAERARIAQRVADAVRADERALANALHDTAATTLLMVGIGQGTDRALLAAQAERDLAVLSTYGGGLPPQADLILLLRAAADLVAARVDFEVSGELFLPSDVAGAIADAAGEALNNVVRHAGVNQAALGVRGDADRVEVEIVDNGRGFLLDQVGDTRRGLRESIYGRMHAIGGRAHISTSLGAGTRVVLEWRYG